jgi:hypothetical protein
LMLPKYPRAKANVWLFCMQVRKARSMRIRVSLDFGILMESFISLCIIETVGAIFREYKPWIILLITQWSKSFKILALSLGLFDLQSFLSFIIRCWG